MAAAAALTGGVALAGSSPAPARAASPRQLQQQISSGRARVSDLKGQVASARKRVGQLDASISTISDQLAAIESKLSAERAELQALRRQLGAARSRLAKLEAVEAHDQAVLAAQVVGSYEQGRPDVITVVMQATGFNQLLDQLAFVQRIQQQDTHIVSTVKAARAAVAGEAITLGALSQRQQRVTEQIQLQDNRVNAIKVGLVRQELAAARIEAAKQGALSSAQAHVASLNTSLSKLEAAQAAAQRAAQQRAAAQQQASAGSSGSGSPGSGSGSSGNSGASPAAGSGPAPTAPSSGGFTFPMPKADASPPGTWSLDDGVDISAPGGTPEIAVCSGTVVLHGIGGFGPSAPVIHCDSPLDGYSYVYYGHAGPGNWVPIGTHVSQGQVISQVGYGIVGISTGPHLEIGFADSSGSPIGPGSAPTMMSLLQAAYGG
ncbi:MAG: murein hydrolase activator EnvC family protein [Solirubrobacteraceae bacterium]